MPDWQVAQSISFQSDEVTIMFPINDNKIDLSKYRGAVRRCPFCTAQKLLTDPSGRTCNVCLGHGFVAGCTNCEGTGIYKGSASAFGGGDVPHNSACNPCGATGFFAVRKPADWKDEVAVAVSVPDSVPVPDTTIVPSMPTVA
jgi:hypothetical protein